MTQSLKEGPATPENPLKTNKKLESLDGGYGWVIVFSTFMIHVIVDSTTYTFGIMNVEFLDEFQRGKGDTAWISSLIPGMMLFTGILSSSLIKNFGTRKSAIAGSVFASTGFVVSAFAPNIYFLYVSYGLVSGFGFGLVILSSPVSIGNYFEKRRSFAMALGICGTGIGTFVFSPTINALITTYGWRGASLIMAGILLNTAVYSALLRPLRTQKPKTISTSCKLKTCNCKPSNDAVTDHQNSSECNPAQHIVHAFTITEQSKMKINSNDMDENKQMCSLFIKNRLSYLMDVVFLLYVASNTLAMFGVRTIYIFLPDRALVKGISRTESAFVLSVAGILSIVGRIFFGWLADRRCESRLAIYCISLIISGTATISIPFYDSYEYYICICGIYGLFSGVYTLVYVLVLVDLVGVDNMANCLGLLWMFRGTATVLGPPVTGWIYDQTGSYDPPFYLIGSLFILSGVLSVFFSKLQHKRNQRLGTKTDDVNSTETDYELVIRNEDKRV